MHSRAFDHLSERLRSVAVQLPDRRTGDNTQYHPIRRLVAKVCRMS